MKKTPNLPFTSVPRMLGRILITAGAALSLASVASGASIGLKMGINGDGNLQSTATGALLPGDIAGAGEYAQANWNILGRWGEVSGVTDSSGANSGVIVNWDASGNWRQGTNPRGTPDGDLMNTYVDSNDGVATTLANTVYGNNNANKPLVYVSGLAAWLATQGATYYDVVVYADGDNDNESRTGEYWLMEASGPTSGLTFGGDLTTHAFICDRANFINTVTYTPVPLISSRGAEAWSGYYPGNYVVFDSLTADSFLLRAEELQFAGGTRRSPINAIQIVPRTAPPLPATVAPLSDLQVYAGGTAKFRSVVGGRAPLTYQWLKNGAPLPDGGNVSGASTPNLTLTGVGAGDIAGYSLVVTNPIGVVTSSVASLSIVTPVTGSYAHMIATNSPYAYWRLNDQGDPAANAAVLDYVGGFNGSCGAGAANGYNSIAGLRPPEFPGFESANAALQSANLVFSSWATLPALNLNTNTVTITAWVYPTTSEAAYTGLIFARNVQTGEATGLGYGGTANYLGYNWNDRTSGFASGLLVPSNQWSFVALVVTPTNASLYLYNTNGQFSTNNAVAHTNAAFSGPLLIGQDSSSPGRAFTGAIDEVAVFNRSFSALEIASLYKKGLGLNIIPPVVANPPRPQGLMESRPAQFTVTATGDAPLSYRWRKDGVNLSDVGNFTGTDKPSLSISAVALADTGDYDLVVGNVAGWVTSSVARLTVIASNSAPVAYEAALRAANPIHYWRLNELEGSGAFDYWGGNIATNVNVTMGVAGPQPSDYVGFEAANAATSYDGVSSSTDTGASLMNNRAQFSIIGWFNSGGTQRDRTGLFGQNDVAEFGFMGINAPGTSADLALWTPGGGSISFATLGQGIINPGQWYLVAGVGDGAKLTIYLLSTDGVRQASASATTTNYGNSISPFRIGGGGILDDPSVDANPFFGQIDEVAMFDRALSVGELATLFGAGRTGGALPPDVSAHPASQTLYATKTAQLLVSAIGTEPLAYQWRKAGVPISDVENLSGTITPTLTITNLDIANAGDYDVVITNVAGAVTSRVATLTVIPAPAGSYQAAVIAANPIAYYRLGELADPSTGTEVAYDYWGGHHGVYASGAQNGFTGVAGPVPPDFAFEANNTGAAFAANTANCWVTAPIGSLSTNTATMTMWIRPTGTFGNWAGLLATRGGGVAGGLGYTEGQLGYTWNNNSTWNYRSGLVPPLNEWSFVAVVIEPAQATVHMLNANGVSVRTNGIAHTSDVFGNNWQIGNDSEEGNGARTFTGQIDEVAVFTYSMTQAQLEQLFVAGGGQLPVSLSIQQVGGDVILSWPSGTLLEADEVTGAWTTNSATSPFTNSAPTSRKFYQVIVK